MKFPIENGTSKPLMIWIEIEAREYMVPCGSKAVVTLGDDPRSYLEVRDDMVVVWNNSGQSAIVELAGPG
jgi:hypothetical protein